MKKSIYSTFLGDKEADFDSNPIVLFQMGMIGAYSLAEEISEKMDGKKIFHIQNLNKESIDKKANATGVVHNIENSILDSIRKNDGKTFKFICMIDEPYSLVSYGFKNAFKNQLEELTGDDEELRKEFIDYCNMYNYSYDYFSMWFDKEMKDTLGIDVFSESFDKDLSFKIYKNDNVELLLIKSSCKEKSFKKAFKQFLGIDIDKTKLWDIRFDYSLNQDQKDFFYRLNIKKEKLAKSLEAKYARYFYTDKEIDELYTKYTSLIAPSSTKKLTNKHIKAKNTPVIVYQMGKVGSKTIVKSLEASADKFEVYHTHALTQESIDSKVKQNAPEDLKTYQKLRNTIVEKGDSINWKLISLTRDPIALFISSIFETMSFKNTDLLNPDGSVNSEKTLERVDDILKIDNGIFKYIFSWFDFEMKKVFGIDVYKYKFDFDKRYTIIKEDNKELLLLRMEDINAYAADAIKDFCNLSDFELVNTNMAKQKSYSGSYNEVKSKIVLSEDFCDAVYSNKVATHFYTKDELAKFTKKWTRK